jgi:predicted metal-dependent phosphoesterase TrpH
LHIHTWCSDGLFAPREVLSSIVEAGIEVAAITDHETASGYLEIKDEVPAGVRLLFGVEFSTYRAQPAADAEGSSAAGEAGPDAADGKPGLPREMHIIGYFPGGVTERIQGFLKELQQERVNRAKVALVGLRKSGCKITYNQLAEHVHGDCVSRAHMARALIAKGCVSSTHEAFNRYLDISRGIVPPPLITPRRVISFILSEGGIPVWAHPQLKSFDMLVKEFADCGLKGVEICNSRRGENYSFYFERTARVLDLLVTYGSDWHGFNNEKIKGIEVPYESVAEFLGMFEGAV